MADLNKLQNETLNRIKEDILKDRDMAIAQTAKRNFVSPSFLVKLAKKIGYDGYKELVIAFKLSTSTITSRDDIDINIIENYSKDKVELLKKFYKAAKHSYVDTVGHGYSEIASNYILADLSEVGFRTSRFVDINDITDENAILFAVSCSGENDEAVHYIERAKFANHKVVSFTRNPKSRIARLSDISFTVGKSFEEKQFGFNGFAACSILAYQSLLVLINKK